MYTHLRQVFAHLWNCNIVIMVHVNSSKFRATFRRNDPLGIVMKCKTEMESARPLRLCFSFRRKYISRWTLFLKIRYHTKFYYLILRSAIFLIFVVPCIMLYSMWNKSNKMQQLRFYSSQWLLLYTFRATISPIIRSTYAVYGHR